MTSTYRDYSYRLAIGRLFNIAALTAFLTACGESSVSAGGTAAPSYEAGSPTLSTASRRVSVNVDLSAIAANVPDSATVFVFVREVGQRMPLGVEQYTVGTLPAVVTFATDKEYSEVEVVARVSRSGRVERAADDHEAQITTRFTASPTPISLSFAKPGATSPAQSLASASNLPSVKPGTAKVEIKLEAKLPSEVAQQFPSSTVIYVTAKSPEQTMPLAVKRMTLGELPARITLTDQDAMLPGRGLSSVSSFFLSARISRSGNASREPGDWEGIAKDSDRLADGTFAIAIDRAID